MLMKNGKSVPQPLLQSLEKDIYALKTFMAMSETYQKLFVMQITHPQTDEPMSKRVEKTIEDIHKYGKANGM